jgi:hypothetical protein
MKSIKGLVIGALALFPIAFIVSCASNPQVAAPCYPPTVYLQDVPEPSLQGKTNHDLVIYLLELKEAIKISNADKKALREWAESP